ncbi:TioE family transcriptional regulator [Streptomyces millisiae]|uniref:TioE family transcriptional regulator n=1 Tax=Streptomyces millisiae TaxID=3075542 RepID=A0ABU2LJ19_9ACTN|nr:TioE family transcriptional regulator [Streptomyces sp. DSM 44918]MDT0317495.1 TioE family transcriptional regulator [Streptomyces sp. DSM 44918]
MSRTRLRPVDLAREHGISTQAVRNYEEAGILPPAERTPHGYRVFTPLHAAALRVFTALVPAHGYHQATAIMRAVNEGATEDALELIDAGHAGLLDDRRTLAAVERALRDLAPPEPDPDESRSMFVGELARRLGIRPATLRKWERAGLVRPRREPGTGYRVYGPTDVRDAQLVRQLRLGGYVFSQIAPLLDQVRTAGGVAPLRGALDDWRARLARRGLAMLAAAAELHDFLTEQGRTPAPPHGGRAGDTLTPSGPDRSPAPR